MRSIFEKPGFSKKPGFLAASAIANSPKFFQKDPERDRQARKTRIGRCTLIIQTPTLPRRGFFVAQSDLP